MSTSVKDVFLSSQRAAGGAQLISLRDESAGAPFLLCDHGEPAAPNTVSRSRELHSCFLLGQSFSGSSSVTRALFFHTLVIDFLERLTIVPAAHCSLDQVSRLFSTLEDKVFIPLFQGHCLLLLFFIGVVLCVCVCVWLFETGSHHVILAGLVLSV